MGMQCLHLEFRGRASAGFYMDNNPKGISLKAVLLGALVDIAGTCVLALGAGMVIGVVLLSQGTPPNQLENRANEFAQEPAVLLGSLGLGMVFTVLGGYVAGRIAK